MTTELDQMAAALAEQAPASTEQVTPVAVEPTEPVAPMPDRAVPEFDFNTPEGIRAAAKQHPAFEAVFADERNRALQKFQSDLRREEGTVERASQTVKWAIDQIEAGADPAAVAKQMAPHVKANQDLSRMEIFQGILDQAKNLDPDSLAPFADLVESLQGSVDEVEKVATVALTAVSNGSRKQGRQEILDSEDIDALPESKLKTALQARVAREATAEVNAREIEAKKPDGIPSAPAGSATEPMNRQRFESMTSDERKSHLSTLTEAQLKDAWSLAVAEA